MKSSDNDDNSASLAEKVKTAKSGRQHYRACATIELECATACTRTAIKIVGTADIHSDPDAAMGLQIWLRLELRKNPRFLEDLIKLGQKYARTTESKSRDKPKRGRPKPPSASTTGVAHDAPEAYVSATPNQQDAANSTVVDEISAPEVTPTDVSLKEEATLSVTNEETSEDGAASPALNAEVTVSAPAGEISVADASSATIGATSNSEAASTAEIDASTAAKRSASSDEATDTQFAAAVEAEEIQAANETHMAGGADMKPQVEAGLVLGEISVSERPGDDPIDKGSSILSFIGSAAPLEVVSFDAAVTPSPQPRKSFSTTNLTTRPPRLMPLSPARSAEDASEGRETTP